MILGSPQDVVQRHDRLAAFELDWCGGGYWFPSTLPDVHEFEAVEGVSIPQGERSVKNDISHCPGRKASGNGGIHIALIVFDLDWVYGIITMSKGADRHADVLIYD